MTTFRNTTSLLCAPLLLLACAAPSDDADQSGDDIIATPGDVEETPATGTRPSGEPSMVTVEGRVAQGVECLTLKTPDGDTWSFNVGEADFGPGDYVQITGEVADASFCQQGRGTLVPQRIEAKDPPARDRDPARAGGLAVTSAYVQGNWVAKGLKADCTRPDFAVTRNRNGGSIIETRINGVPATGYVDVGDTPALQWDEGIPPLPIETRGPDGLAVMPAAGANIVTLAGHRIEGDGVVFVKCAD
ncbi:DUF5818 domain-containing protein [Citromicrobium bathyomarinum]|uniref:DUF5818 domain-containing protein n=1 Tax=Citromicrobium bathyomarinum TaxID=72174 RepID=UPI00315A8D62